MKPLLSALVTGLMLLFKPLLAAEGPNDHFVRIYNLIQQADALAESGQSDPARQKYLEAQTELKTLRKASPGWNETVVEFRLKYVAEKLEPLTSDARPRAQAAPDKKSDRAVAGGESADLIPLLEEQNRQLKTDKELLQAKLKEALTAQPAAVDPRELARAEEQIKSMQKEIEVLKVTLAKSESKPDKPVDPAVLAETRKALATANQKLEQQMDMAAALTLEMERRQKRLQAFVDGAEMRTLREENAVLRGRLDALEAAKAPYSREELALLKAPDSGPVNNGAGSDRESSRSLPAAARELLADAERAFSERRYRQAERKYSQALHFDGKNAALLANLARVQIEQNRMVEAEINLNKALASDPKDGVSWSLLGTLKVRQKKYDEALDALSRATQLDPQNADAFQSLGLVLAEKGLRGPAESAFRRAITLAPGNATAHHHLAVIYATQQPPALELARWHYQKARDAGHPKDAKLEKILSANKPAVDAGARPLKR